MIRASEKFSILIKQLLCLNKSLPLSLSLLNFSIQNYLNQIIIVIMIRLLYFRYSHFKKNFNLEYKPTWKGILFRFQRNHYKKAKLIKLAILFTIFTTTSYLFLPGSMLPYQRQLKINIYHKIVNFYYSWYITTTANPNFEIYYIKSLQTTLKSINQQTHDWQWVFRLLNQTFDNQNDGYNKKMLSDRCKLTIIMYASIILQNIIQYHPQLLNKQQTVTVFTNICKKHLTLSKKQLNKEEQQEIQTIYGIIQYVLKYQTNKEEINDILDCYYKAIKNNSFVAKNAFMRKSFLNSLKNIHAKDKQNNSSNSSQKIIKIFDFLDTLRQKQRQIQKTIKVQKQQPKMVSKK